jgi:mRNA-degrading endonuclease RelE of RelBE toxin-antitoxin system
MQKIERSKKRLENKAGDYRVIYEIEDKQLHILVVAIGHRKDIYG